jgi:hypothetical protein
MPRGGYLPSAGDRTSELSRHTGFVAAYRWHMASKEYDAPDIDLDDPLGETIAWSGAIKGGRTAKGRPE